MAGHIRMNFSVNKRVKNRVTRLHFSQARWAFLLLFILSLSTLADDGDDLSQEPPPVRSGEQYIYLGKEQSTEITINQKPGEFTLLVLEAQGVDFTMELLNPKTEPGPQYYNDTWFESYLNLNFLLKSSDCETCRIKITTSYKYDRNIPFLVRFDTFDQLTHKHRLFAENTVHENLLNSFPYDSFNYDNFYKAADYLESLNSNNSKLRACFYKVSFYLNLSLNETDNPGHDRWNQATNQQLHCVQLANQLGDITTAILSQLEYFRLSIYSSRTESAKHIQKIDTLIKTYKSKIEKTDRLPLNYFVLTYSFFLKGIILNRLDESKSFYESKTDVENIKNFIYYSKLAGSIHLAKTILPHIGVSFSNKSMPVEAFNLLQYSIELHHDTVNNKLKKTFPYDSLFLVLFNFGDFYHANQLLQTDKSSGYFTYYELSNYYFNAQLLYSIGRFELAEQEINQFLATINPDNNFTYLQAGYSLLADIYEAAGQIENAKSALQDALNLYKERDDELSRNRMDILLAQLALLNNNPERVLNFYPEISNHHYDSYVLFQILSYKITALEKLGRHQQAYNELLEFLERPIFKNNNIFSVQIYSDLVKFSLLANLPSDIVRDHTKKAIQLFESLRTTQASIQLRQNILASQRQLFELVLSTELAATDNIQQLGFSTLFSAESFKARTLYDIFINNQPLPSQSVSSDNVETILEGAKKRYEKYFAENADKSQFTNQILSTTNLRRYQQGLGKRQGVLYFFSGESFGRVWLITQSAIESYALPEHSKLSLAVNEFLAVARQRPAGGQVARSALTEHQQRVSRLLLSDLGEQLAELDQLTIVPDASLHRLPFSFLVNPATQKPLVESTQLRYASSIATDQWLNQAPDPELQSPKLLVVANPTPNNSNAIAATHTSIHQTNKNSGADGPLANNQAALVPIQRFGGRQGIPGADREAHALIDLWQQRYQQGQSQLLRGSQATKQSLLAEPLEQYQILHFATHAEVDWDNPQLSAIQLARNAEQELLLDTPHLSVGEISQLELNAALVVLSACDTASGKLITGEGPIGLSRAFIEAGAKRVLSTLWPVDDEATALLQEKFYQGLLTDNLTPAEALRQAQLFIRNQPQYQHPYFWAGFMFIGKSETWLDTSE